MIDSKLAAQALAVKCATEQHLLALPGVHGVGLGWKETRGQLTEVPALRVYVAKKQPKKLLDSGAIVPREIAGVSTDVLPLATGLALSGEPYPSNTLRAVGSSISNLKSVLDKSVGDSGNSGLGTLGMFAAMNGKPGWKHLVLVSNRHVLFANGACQGDLVYQPRYVLADGRYHFDAYHLHPIAELFDEGREGNYTYCYPGEGAKPYFIDCAAARLLIPQGTQIHPVPQAHCGGRKALFKCVARVHAFDTFAGRELRVHMLGRDERIGRVVDVMATVMSSDGEKRYNNIVIRAESRAGGFATVGDSGALLVDDLRRAVGLVWGKSLQNTAEAFACHIHPVLHCLNVTPLRYNLQPQSEF